MLTPSIPWDIAARSQRERILQAMAKSCAEKTFAGTTIADIVGRASISRATFYKHFGNKTECFYAATDHFLAELQGTAVDARAGASSDPKGAEIRTVMAAVLELLAAKPDHAKLLLIEAPNVGPEIVSHYRGLVIDALDKELRDDGGGWDGADPEIAFGRAKVLVADYVAGGGKVKHLSSLLPELVYLALLPYVGHSVALAQAQADR